MFCKIIYSLLDILYDIPYMRKFSRSSNFRGQYESAKIKIGKYFPISVKELSLEATSIFAAVTSSFPCFVKFRLFSFVPVRSFFQQVKSGARPIMTA